jgi:hypothetical protein
MAEAFNPKDIKTPSYKQVPNTKLGKIAAKLGVSTKNNIVILSPVPARYAFRSGLMREDVSLSGFVNGSPNGRVIQTIGDAGWIIDVELDFSYGKYIQQRNQYLKILTSNKGFNLQTFTTQQYQTVPALNIGSKANYFYGFASDVSFDDSYDGRSFANGNDKIKFTFYVVPQAKSPKSKKSIFAAIDKAVNYLDKIQSNISQAVIALQGVNATLIETAKTISSFGSDVASFIQEVNELKSTVGTLINNPIELAQSFANTMKSFQGLFSSGDSSIQKQYYSILKNLTEYNKGIVLNIPNVKQKDGSVLPVYDNIEKNIILGKVTNFMRSNALLIMCNNYENYDFENTDEAFQAWQNIVNAFHLFASETMFDGLQSGANISSNFTNSTFDPEAFNAVRDYVYQTLEVIRNVIFNEKDITYQIVSEASNVYEVVIKKYGVLDEEILKSFMLINNISSFDYLIKSGTQVKFA